MLEFRVLGPLEIRRGGAPLPLRAAKQRVFLADLLINRGTVVSVDRLIEDVWPATPPAGARHALETHASRLRAYLGDDVHLIARAPGYILDVDPQSIDSVRFEQLLSEAREAQALEPARAAARAEDALALWRGDAYADFAFDSFAQEEIARLEELRHEAEEERIEAELALGRSGELIGELEALVAAKPLRERRRGQLMLALYRAGRQADALDAYRAAREALLDELGLDPGPELRELERRILQHDGTLTGERRAASAGTSERRLVTVVAVEPNISLDLDAEEHERGLAAARATVARIAGEHHAELPEPFVLAFAQEDHGARALAAATALHDALDASVGLESGEALLGDGSVGGPVVARARERARAADLAPAGDIPVLERRFGGPFVGRTEELARLRETRAALVIGPPGIGKSRLARELAAEQRVVVGRCSAYGSDSLAPLCEVAAELGSPDALDDAWASEVPLLFRRLCESSGDALLVVFDDVHWADALVLETIEHLVSQGDDDVRVVCLAREELLEERPTFLPGAERLVLAPLPPEDALALAEQLGAADGFVAERAEGNPLFIEQLLAYANEGAEQIPSSLQALLAARLDRLTPSERIAIEHAAVIGREFDAALVAELLDARTARRPLAALVRRGLLDPAPPSAAFEERYRFRHVLIHEAAYAAASRAERARLHESVADILAARSAGDETVGFHLERAAELRPDRDRHAQRLAEDAGRRLGAAGITAWKRNDAATGCRLLGRAVSLLPRGDEQRRELIFELGVALSSAGRPDHAGEVLAEALEIAEAVGDRRLALRARIELAMARVLDEPRDAAAQLLELAEGAMPIFRSVADERSLGRTSMLAGWVKGGVYGRHRDWEAHAEQALVHYRRAGWPPATSIGHIAAAAFHGPTPASTGIARCRELLETEVEDLGGEANVSACLGGLLAMTGVFAEAQSMLERARSLYTDLGRTPALHATCSPIEAAVARMRGDLEGAAEVLEQSCVELQSAHRPFYLATQAAELADVLALLGRSGDAGRWLDVAERNAPSDDVISQIWLGVARARVGAALGELDEALAAAREAVALADGTDALNARANAHVTLADVFEAGGSVADARSELGIAAALLAEKENAAAADRLSRRVAAAAGSGSPS